MLDIMKLIKVDTEFGLKLSEERQTVYSHGKRQ